MEDLRRLLRRSFSNAFSSGAVLTDQAHMDDKSTPLEETLCAFAGLDGHVA